MGARQIAATTASVAVLALVAGVLPADAARPQPPRFEAATSATEATVAPSITIAVDADPDAAQDFTFTGCNTATGCGDFTLDDDTDLGLPSAVTADSLPPGTYTVTQAAAGNWNLTAITCTTSEAVQVGNRRVTITLDAGEDVACTFTERSAAITIVEQTYPATDQDFSFTGCQGAGCAPFSLDDDDDPALPDRVSASGLAPGTYTVTQSPAGPWALTSIACTTTETKDYANGRVIITLSANEQTQCTFTNRKALITLALGLQSTAGPESFPFTTCHAGTGCGAISLSRDTRSVTAQDPPLGHYTLTQAAVPGYALYTIECTPEAYPVVGIVTQTAEFDLVPGRQVNCTFRNIRAGPPLTGVTQISAGNEQSCALLAAGTVRCGGALAAPVDDSLVGVSQIDAGGSHRCAVHTDGTASCWGSNTSGQLGDGTNQARNAPVVVTNEAGTGPLTGVRQISAGDSHTCAVTQDTRAWCWGDNTRGKLGRGTSGGVFSRPSPSGTRPAPTT